MTSSLLASIALVALTDSVKTDTTTTWQKNLDGVTVVARKPLVKSDIDKLTYDMESDPESKTNTIIEMLRKVPMVTVDGEDNIKVNGSSSFKVYVDGKPNAMMTNNPTQVLKSMPANMIKKIEVITNPGPKYDAEGVGGVLNIITRGKGLEGYNLTLGANANTNGALGANVFGIVQKDKLMLSAGYSYWQIFQPRRWGGTDRTLKQATDDNSANLHTEKTTKANSNYHNANIEASYELDSLNLFSASFGLNGGSGSGDITTQQQGLSPLTSAQLYSYTSNNHTKQHYFSVDFGFDYQRSFSVKERLLTVSYKLNTHPSKQDDTYTYTDLEAQPDWTSYLKALGNQTHQYDGSTTEHTFQIDFTTPFAKIHSMEAGAKYILRNNKSNDDRSVENVYNEQSSSHYRHRNDILAAYLGYGVGWKAFSARLGLRYEHTWQSVKYLLGRGDDFTKQFNDFVPSASVGWKVSDAVNFRLGYNLRIYRPSIGFLNPYIDDSNPSSISTGNPNLDTEKEHQVSLGFNLNTNTFSLNLNIGGYFNNNSIEYINKLVDDRTIAGLPNPTGKNVLFNTCENIGSVKKFNTSGFVSWNPFKNTRIYSNFMLTYSHLSDGISNTNHGWFFNAYSGINQTLPKDWKIGLTCYVGTPYVQLQGHDESSHDYGLNITKSFLSKRLTIGFHAGYWFHKYEENHDAYTENDTYRETEWSKRKSRRLNFSITYRFGDLKTSVKKAERTIENDDLK